MGKTGNEEKDWTNAPPHHLTLPLKWWTGPWHGRGRASTEPRWRVLVGPLLTPNQPITAPVPNAHNSLEPVANLAFEEAFPCWKEVVGATTYLLPQHGTD